MSDAIQSELRREHARVLFQYGTVCAMFGVQADDDFEDVKAALRLRMVNADVVDAYRRDNTTLRRQLAAAEERFAALFTWAKSESTLDPQHATLEQLLQDAFERARGGAR